MKFDSKFLIFFPLHYVPAAIKSTQNKYKIIHNNYYLYNKTMTFHIHIDFLMGKIMKSLFALLDIQDIRGVIKK